MESREGDFWKTSVLRFTIGHVLVCKRNKWFLCEQTTIVFFVCFVFLQAKFHEDVWLFIETNQEEQQQNKNK